ncbi:MAG: putative monovalent cation/H+ antiporter subunit A [Phycisphaerae bacterium]|jgi:multicomponent Na+:H+ antiporter subunit A|nr:putative monovalent cation/H+ antiporter subunit A [Phycisphaerae bacterium]
MPESLLFGFALAAFSPLIHRFARGATGWVMGALVAGLTVRFALYVPAITAGNPVRTCWAWVPPLGVNVSFYLDGLSLLFALLICGIGSLVAIYAGGSLRGHPQLGRFYLYLLAFMTSMLGVVLADNLLTLYVFWELTSLTSYLLIGFNHEDSRARQAALQALLVTVAGGLAMLAGFVLLGLAGGSFEISVLSGRGPALREHATYLPLLALILAGAFTKSAQFPFHFWLPNAMVAPTPVSAYLHSSTMVKAGVYLLARLSPVLADTAAWTAALSTVGAVTMVIGATLALLHTDLKRILAYTTISVLGGLTLLLGLGTSSAVVAAMALLVAHALYKAALFLVAGNVDHATGIRDVRQASGLARVMPITAAAAVLAAMSNAGVPASFGFISKELIYEAIWGLSARGLPLLAATFLANALLVTTAILVGVRPFFGRRTAMPHMPHETPIALWLGPLVLALGGLVLGLVPARTEPMLAAAATAVEGQPAHPHLALWPGFNVVLALSAVTVLGGIGLYLAWERVRRVVPLATITRFGADRGYDLTLEAMLRFGTLQTRVLQSGYLRFYLIIIILTVVSLAGWALLKGEGVVKLLAGRWPSIYEWIIAGLVPLAALLAILSQSRLTAVIALGTVGYGLALLYLLYGAPDLAMTQFAIETLTVVLFVLVVYRLPPLVRFANWPSRVRDAMVALAGGALMTGLLLAATARPGASSLSPFYAEHSLSDAYGRNVVNVILVDFRALDTLGEITVLTVAAIGVHALLRLLPGRKGPRL